MKNKYMLYGGIFLCLLPILVMRDYTPNNELRYLSIADEAIRNGNVFTFTNQGLPYADKPPLYFWIVMLGKYVLGNHYMWFLSLFSILPAFVIVDVMDRWSAPYLSGESRLSGKLLLMSCGLFLGLALVLRMDMLMCMFIVLALHTFYRMLKKQGNARRNSILFPVYVFLALFSKGPVGVLVPLLSTFVFLGITGRFSAWNRYWGGKTWGIILVGCLAWFLGVYWEGGGDYLHNLLFHQTVDRAVNSFHHEEPFYYYFISVWYSLAPWSLLFIGVIGAGLYRRLIRSDLEKFFLTVLLTTWVMLSFISSKIAIYLAPAFPFMVYLAVLLLTYFRWNRWLAAAVALPAAAFCSAVPVLFILATTGQMLFLKNFFLYAASLLLTAAGIYSLYLLYRWKAFHRSVQTLAAGLFLALFVGGWALPSLNGELGYAALCGEAKKLAGEKNTAYCTWKLSRPENMDVFLEKDVRKISREQLLEEPLTNSLLLMPAKVLRRDEEIKKLVAGKEKHTVGRYIICVFQ